MIRSRIVVPLVLKMASVLFCELCSKTFRGTVIYWLHLVLQNYSICVTILIASKSNTISKCVHIFALAWQRRPQQLSTGILKHIREPQSYCVLKKKLNSLSRSKTYCQIRTGGLDWDSCYTGNLINCKFRFLLLYQALVLTVRLWEEEKLKCRIKLQRQIRRATRKLILWSECTWYLLKSDSTNYKGTVVCFSNFIEGSFNDLIDWSRLD